MSQKVLDSGSYNAVARGKYGYVVYNKNDSYVGKAVEKYGEFSEAEVELFSQICRPGDFVMEVGANIGTHTLAFSRIVGEEGHVFAFEPQPIVFYTLCANVAINSLNNVDCYNLAAGATEGSVFIPTIRYDQPGNFGGVALDQFKQGRQVSRVPLDNFADLPRLRLIKIDVEGMEGAVIRGAKRLIKHHKPVLYVENDREERSQALIELIRSLDYRLYWHLPRLFNPNNFAGDGEDLYPSGISVNMLCLPNEFAVELEGFTPVTDTAFHPKQLHRQQQQQQQQQQE